MEYRGGFGGSVEMRPMNTGQARRRGSAALPVGTRCCPFVNRPWLGKTHARLALLGNMLLANRLSGCKLTAIEPSAKAILPAPRRVQRANSHQA